MAKIFAYLTFDGQSEEAFNFYKEIFGAEFQDFQRFSEMPGNEKLSEKDKNRLMHVSLPISDGSILMGSDTLSTSGKKVEKGNNFSLSVDAASEAEATKIFEGLAKEGTITMPIEKTFWNAYFGMLTDKFGINWMVNYDY